MHGDGFPNHPVSWLLLRSPSPWHRRQLHHLFDGQQVRLAPRPRRRSHYAPIPADDRTFLADLHPLVGNQHRSFFRAQNKVYIVKLAGPEVAVGVAHRPSQVNRAASVLHGVIKKLHMSDAGCLLAIRGQPHRRFQHAARHLLLNRRQITSRSWPFFRFSPSWKWRSTIRPPTCGVTVTDSNAAFLPISSRYFGTYCAVAFATVTSGGGVAGAPPAPRLGCMPRSSTALLPLIPVVQREKMGYSLTFLSSSFSKTLLFYAEAPSAENI